jgi:pimeloyl-ACP methyl ester carboxylesterase
MRGKILLFSVILPLTASLIACGSQRGSVKSMQDLPPNLHLETVNGVPVVYSDQGQGETLMILSPYPFGTAIWEPFVNEVTGSLRVVVVEPPGLRDPDSMRKDFSSEHLLQIYREFVKKLGLDTVHVLGVGETGGLAVAFGHHFPQHTRSAVSINGFEAVTWSEEIKDLLGRFQKPSTTGMKILLPLVSLHYLQQPPSEEEIERLVSGFAKGSLRHAIQARIKALEQDIRAGYIPAMIESINFPVLIVRSEQDTLLSEQHTARSVEHIADAQFASIPEAGHWAFLDNPDRLAVIIRAFIEAPHTAQMAARTDAEPDDRVIGVSDPSARHRHLH